MKFARIGWIAALAGSVSSVALAAPAPAPVPAAPATSSSASGGPPPSGAQWKRALEVIRDLRSRVQTLESRNGGGSPNANANSGNTGDEEAIDLGIPGSAAATGGAGGGGPKNPHGNLPSTASVANEPRFRAFFDLNLVSRPGVAPLTFDNYHAFLFFEQMPTPQMQFAFDVSPAPKFFELDYQMTPTIQLRAGKIWIPFDDLSPHNLFGGRVNVSRLSSGAAFLPDIWTDLGVGLKFQLVDRPGLNLIAHTYVVNGFRAGGIDPLTVGSPYPSFGDLPSTADNNADKAIGGRLQGTLGWLSVGVSGYRGRWSDESKTARSLLIYGADTQLRAPIAELRLGYAGMKSQLSDTVDMTRGGLYGELGRGFGRNQLYKLLLRGGTVQLDNRVIAATDQTLVGGTVLYRPGFVELSIEHSRDLKRLASKVNYSYTALRLAIGL